MRGCSDSMLLHMLYAARTRSLSSKLHNKQQARCTEAMLARRMSVLQWWSADGACEGPYSCCSLICRDERSGLCGLPACSLSSKVPLELLLL